MFGSAREKSVAEIFGEYPNLEPEDVQQALEYAACIPYRATD